MEQKEQNMETEAVKTPKLLKNIVESCSFGIHLKMMTREW